MKKTICIFIAVTMCVALFGCGSGSNGKSVQGNGANSVEGVLDEKMNEGSTTSAASDQGSKEQPTAGKSTDTADVDVDLTKMSSTMVYSEVSNMVSNPESYLGKKVRMNGSFAYYEGNNRYYFACIIADATACCSQGIEFVLKDKREFPREYPKDGAQITVVGTFDTYNEGSNRYCQLTDANMVLS